MLWIITLLPQVPTTSLLLLSLLLESHSESEEDSCYVPTESHQRHRKKRQRILFFVGISDGIPEGQPALQTTDSYFLDCHSTSFAHIRTNGKHVRKPSHHFLLNRSANFGILTSSPKNRRQCLLTVSKINPQNSFDSLWEVFNSLKKPLLKYVFVIIKNMTSDPYM